MGTTHLPSDGSDKKLVCKDFVADLGNINGFLSLNNFAKGVIFRRQTGRPFTRPPERDLGDAQPSRPGVVPVQRTSGLQLHYIGNIQGISDTPKQSFRAARIADESPKFRSQGFEMGGVLR
jgi:hypothetical protein